MTRRMPQVFSYAHLGRQRPLGTLSPAYHGRAGAGRGRWAAGWGMRRGEWQNRFLHPALLFAEPALGREEVGQGGGAAVGQHAADDLRTVVEPGVGGDAVERLTGAGL